MNKFDAFDYTYNSEWVLKNNKDKKYVFFWQAFSSGDKITSSCMSQWYKSTITIDNKIFCNMEQYMMACKAELFNDDLILEKIMNESDPKNIKALGRKVRNFDEIIWKSVRYDILVKGNYYKFMQDSKLKEFILNTGDSILAEASPYDKLYGIGLRVENSNVRNPSSWQGINLLGFALMEVRDLIRSNWCG